jgi:hypothetical protein
MKNSDAVGSSSITVNSCSAFILGFVDSSALVSGQSTGVYFVDNLGGSGSSGEGSSSLQTVTARMSNVAWRVLSLNPNDGYACNVQSIGSSNAWGPDGQPSGASGPGAYYTGQVQNAGSANYQIELNVVSTVSGNVFQPVTLLGMTGTN